MKRLMKLPTDLKLPTDCPETFPGIPLKGHISSLKRGEKKYYWLVEGLIEKSVGLSVFEADVGELLAKIGSGTWFGKDEKVTIQLVLNHIDRALKADLSCPIILASDGKVMDGSHRIMGAYIKGIKTLKAVTFEIDPEPDYVLEQK